VRRPAVKLKYLGDSKDSFKWDFHDYLTSQLGYSTLNVVPMLTPDDASNDGQTDASDFPARNPVIKLCGDLRKSRDLEGIRCLPAVTGASYRIELYRPATYLTQGNRWQYFANLRVTADQVLFLDPDNGFEPEKSHNEKHILYSDLEGILAQSPDTVLVSVFHHFRRISFAADYARIRERIIRGYSTAIYWRSLMFVAVAKRRDIIGNVEVINQRYAAGHPVKVLDAKAHLPGTSSRQSNLTLFGA
jgi:hypothetical protein